MHDSPRGRPTPYFVATVCSTGLALVMLDNTAVTVGLVSIQRGLGGSLEDLQWIASVMPLTAAIALPIASTYGERVGARQAMQLGLLVFGLGSMLAIISQSFGMLMVARGLQGAGAALMLPNGAALLGANVSAGHARNRAVGLWVTISSIGLIIGPLIGGPVIDTFGWRWIFLPYIPIALAGAIAAKRLRSPETRVDGRPDIEGITFAALGLGLLCWSLISLGQAGDASPLVVVAIVGAGACFVLFNVFEKRAAQPVLDMKLLSSGPYGRVLLAALLYNSTIAGVTFLVAVLFQRDRDFSPTAVGYIILLATVGMPLGSQVTSRLAKRWNPVQIIAGTVLFLSLAYLSVSVFAFSSVVLLCLPLLALGFGAGVVYSADTLAVLDNLPERDASSALAALSLTRQVGAVIGIALMGSIARVIDAHGSTPWGGRIAIAAACLLVLPGAFLLLRLQPGKC